MATRREIVVIMSANELSIGITKLSGSSPLLKVTMATADAMVIMNVAATMFVVKSCFVDLSKLSCVISFCTRVEIME